MQPVGVIARTARAASTASIGPLGALVLALVAASAPADTDSAVAATPTDAQARASEAEALDPYAFLGLESSSSVPRFRVDGWNSIDERSLIVWGTQKDLYLFILVSRCWHLTTSEAIAVSNTAGQVMAGFDEIAVLDDGIRMPCKITRIYRLAGLEQLRDVKKQVKTYHRELRRIAREAPEAGD